MVNAIPSSHGDTKQMDRELLNILKRDADRSRSHSSNKRHHRSHHHH